MFYFNYRIKTEEEFIASFGCGWRNVVQFSWTKLMDKLFGVKLTWTQASLLFAKDRITIGTYHISKDMVVRDTLFKKEKVVLNDSLWDTFTVTLSDKL